MNQINICVEHAYTWLLTKLSTMVEVFKTNVQETEQARELVTLLQQHFPHSKINFDLDDCDKVLRIEGNNFIRDKVMMFVKDYGFYCNVLE